MFFHCYIHVHFHAEIAGSVSTTTEPLIKPGRSSSGAIINVVVSVLILNVCLCICDSI